MKRFFVNDTLVDTDRCRLQRGNIALALEPKVIQVLQLLARHRGEVVSHQALLDAVWPHTIVEPGALQRCIAQLRKAFGDDARQQKVIATYPKRGYSLVAVVREDIPESPRLAALQTVRPDTRYRWPALAAGLAVLLVTVGFMLPGAEQQPAQATATGTSSHMLDNPALLAAIAEPDDFPVYSPDGRYVVYPRYLEERRAHLWARDLAYGNDFMMTEEAGVYEHLAWSRDSSQVVFVDATCQLTSCQAGACSSLKSLSVSQSETQTPGLQRLIDCSPRRLLSPEFLNNRELAVIELADDLASLVRYDLKTGARELLYESNDMIPYRLSYSRQTSTLTIMAINPYGSKELLFLDTRTGILNRNNSAVFRSEEDWYPSSNPL